MKAQYSNTIIYIYNILLYDSAWLGFGFGLAWFFQSICVNCTYICIYNVCVCIIYIYSLIYDICQDFVKKSKKLKF